MGSQQDPPAARSSPSLSPTLTKGLLTKARSTKGLLSYPLTNKNTNKDNEETPRRRRTERQHERQHHLSLEVGPGARARWCSPSLVNRIMNEPSLIHSAWHLVQGGGSHPTNLSGAPFPSSPRASEILFNPLLFPPGCPVPGPERSGPRRLLPGGALSALAFPCSLQLHQGTHGSHDDNCRLLLVFVALLSAL